MGRFAVNRYFKLNHQIQASEVRVIDDEGKQLGVMSLQDALKKAQELELDLIEIAPEAKPPVAKIIDYKKFQYLEDQKRKEARKHTKQTDLKEVRFSPFIGEHDMEVGIKRIRKFLSVGDLVKISIVFKGRQMAHTEFGPKLLEKIMGTIGEEAITERPARFEGRRFVTVIRGTKKVKVEKPKQKNETEN